MSEAFHITGKAPWLTVKRDFTRILALLLVETELAVLGVEGSTGDISISTASSSLSKMSDLISQCRVSKWTRVVRYHRRTNAKLDRGGRSLSA